MAKAKKFGAFGGVFTPSILTILGVIMYLRLPWITGQAGLFMTIVIIVVAHVVSITSGLSVSSIATDKKVKAGGNYYIISRSLGLPIGGTLGLALFVGLSFSISLYLIGFTESLLDFLNLPLEINTIRIYGTITLVIVTILIFISTSLAIKAQYFILAAVMLSLVSVFLGGSTLSAQQTSIGIADNSPDLFVLFAIFFPAVTGFTAGVQMSGDLKDPQKAIPRGTIAAITFGFVVYIALAIFSAFRIDNQLLITNPNVLVEIAYFPEFVLAGIWGATLSSAIGSILGAPRILQATSFDRITPKFFAKGYGPLNEPRRAILLTFVIAEVGILIGELNIIARIVSIFFISTYGLINLSYAVEAWASTDFRPSFKIPIWVSISGFIICLVLMFELDILAFIGSITLLTLIYLFLKRKELKLESGDAWGSFWLSMVRSGLHKLQELEIHKRNWRPNILLFGGSKDERGYLLRLGEWISGKNGIISNFELIESPSGIIRFSKEQQIVKDRDFIRKGIFHKRLECQDIYSGIESVAQFYGFAGIEPNTVLLGWPRNTKDPARVTQLVKKLEDLDYNVAMLDFDADREYGKFKQIDLWWRGGSNNVTLALALLRFLQSSYEWRTAKLRLLIILEDTSLSNKVHKNLTNLLQDLRQDAEIKIINNSIKRRPFYDIIEQESASADLTILGLPDFRFSHANTFVQNVSELINSLGNVILLRASSFFEPYFIGIEMPADTHLPDRYKQFGEEKITNLVLPEFAPAARQIEFFNRQAELYLQKFSNEYIRKIDLKIQQLTEQLEKELVNTFSQLKKNLHFSGKNIYDIQHDFFYKSKKTIKDFKKSGLNSLEINLEHGIQKLLEDLNQLLENQPKKIEYELNADVLRSFKSDSFSLRGKKFSKKILNRFSSHPPTVKIEWRLLSGHHLIITLRELLLKQVEELGQFSYDYISEIQKYFSRLQNTFIKLQIAFHSSGTSDQKIFEETEKLNQNIMNMNEDRKKFFSLFFINLINQQRHLLSQKLSIFGRVNTNQILSKKYKLKNEIKPEKFAELPAVWIENLSYLLEFAQMEISLYLLRNKLEHAVSHWLDELENNLGQKLFSNLKKIETDNKNPEKIIAILKSEIKSNDLFQIDLLKTEINKAIQDIPENIEVLSEDSFQDIQNNTFHEPEIITVAFRRLISYLLDYEFISQLSSSLEAIKKEIKNALLKLDETWQLLNEKAKKNKTSSALPDLNFDNITKLSAAKQQKLHDHLKEFRKKVDQQLILLFEKMNPYMLTHKSDTLKDYIFSSDKIKVLSGFEKLKYLLKKYTGSVKE